MQFVANSVVSHYAISAAQRVSTRGVKKGCSAIAAHGGFVWARGTQPQTYSRDVFDVAQNGTSRRPVLLQPFMAAFGIR